MLRFSIREMLWLTLVVAIGTAWWTESFHARQWRQRAEIAANHLETENLGKIVFTNSGVLFRSPDNQPPFDIIFTPTDDRP